MFASFMFIIPLTFVANTFVRPEFLPGPLRSCAERSPVSAVAQASREAFGEYRVLAAAGRVAA